MEKVDELVRYTDARGGAHRAGTFAPDVLARIQLMMDQHLGGKPLRTAETGCGASTILFSDHGGEHIAYCLDDTGEENSSVSFARECPLFKSRNTRFVFGPTQRTLIAEPPDGEFDMVLIDGPHAFPFPEIEYFFFFDKLKSGGVLVVDDIHIPTIRHLFDVIRADDMFMLHSVVRRTAFFVRTGLPGFPRDGDGWPSQRFNAQRFPASLDDLTRTPPLALPFHLAGRKVADTLMPYVDRGFVEFEDTFATEGRLSILRIVLGKQAAARMRVSLVIRPFFAAERPGASCQITAQHKSVEQLSFASGSAGQHRVSFTVEQPGELLHLRFENFNVRQLRHLNEVEENRNPFYQLGLAILEFQAVPT